MKQLVTIIISLIVGILFNTTIIAQSPEKMSYQAVVRDANDDLIINQSVGMQISILQGSADGNSVYVERHFPTTNANGLVTIIIGAGTILEGDFTDIDWMNGPYFLKTETDLNGGANYTIARTSQLLSVPYALHAKTAETVTETDPTVTKYSVGDFAQGGVVFWVDETGQHGLVCAKEDQSIGVRWYAGTNGITRATGDGLNSGELNTAIIISSQVSIGDDGLNYAAQICNDLQVTEGGTNYGDWYLPSKEELNLLYQNKATIDATAEANGGSDFNGLKAYWSSTEADNLNAWMQFFGYDYQGSRNKVIKFRVRAIRSF